MGQAPQIQPRRLRPAAAYQFNWTTMSANNKSTVDQIRARFDADVERFSKLETGQSATMDAPLALELVAQACGGVCPKARSLLDVGCGAGNYSLKILEAVPDLDITL